MVLETKILAKKLNEDVRIFSFLQSLYIKTLLLDLFFFNKLIKKNFNWQKSVVNCFQQYKIFSLQKFLIGYKNHVANLFL